ncbi:MAG: TraX family protein [Eubacteriales bacterium]
MKPKLLYGISGAVLKNIAIFSMCIDHFAAIVLNGWLQVRNTSNFVYYTQGFWQEFLMSPTLNTVYYTMRCIGRLAFPIFAFLIVEGVFHTRKPFRYLGRLAIFALISDVPFDLAFRGTFYTTRYQNVLFTLLIGAVTIMCMEQLRKKSSLPILIKGMGLVGFLLMGSSLAELWNTDYGMYGILTIVVIYFLRGKPILQGIAGASVLYSMTRIQIYSYPVVFLLERYNGNRGRQNQYFFYLFYPLHILVFYGILQGIMKYLL